jgi:hypothetical protein
VTGLDLEALCVSIARDASLLACANADNLRPNLALLEEAQDELARAIGKCERRIAA